MIGNNGSLCGILQLLNTRETLCDFLDCCKLGLSILGDTKGYILFQELSF